MSVVFPLYLNRKSKQPTLVQPVKIIIKPAPLVVPPAPLVVQPAPLVVQPAPLVVQPDPLVVQPDPLVVQPAPLVVKPSHHDTISIKTNRYGIKNFSSTTNINITKKRNI